MQSKIKNNSEYLLSQVITFSLAKNIYVLINSFFYGCYEYKNDELTC